MVYVRGILKFLNRESLYCILLIVSLFPSTKFHGEMYLKHYVIKFVSDLRQVGGFFRVLWFPPPIKMTTAI